MFLSHGKDVLALGRALTKNHDGFLKGFIPQKTKQHSPVRHKHSGCGALRKLEAGAVPQDVLTRVWLMVVPASLSLGPHGLCAVSAQALGALSLHQELPASY